MNKFEKAARYLSIPWKSQYCEAPVIRSHCQISCNLSFRQLTFAPTANQILFLEKSLQKEAPRIDQLRQCKLWFPNSAPGDARLASLCARSLEHKDHFCKIYFSYKIDMVIHLI